MKYRKGDRVSVEGVVKYDHEGGNDSMAIVLEDSYDTAWIHADHVKLVQQRIDVGDKVWTDVLGVEFPGEIVSVRGDKAWVDIDGVMNTYGISDLKRADS